MERTADNLTENAQETFSGRTPALSASSFLFIAVSRRDAKMGLLLAFFVSPTQC